MLLMRVSNSRHVGVVPLRASKRISIGKISLTDDKEAGDEVDEEEEGVHLSDVFLICSGMGAGRCESVRRVSAYSSSTGHSHSSCSRRAHKSGHLYSKSNSNRDFA